MSQQELLISVVEVLRQVGAEFMLTGSFASSLQGEPRSTHDIDFVVELTAAQVGPLLKQFPNDRFYLSETAVREAIKNRRMFNLLELESGYKVDFWLLTDSPFDRSRFARRVADEIGGVTLGVSSPEDTILAKLRWAKAYGGSEKQFTDALSVFEIQGGTLDRDYLQHWVTQLELNKLWLELLSAAKDVEGRG